MYTNSKLDSIIKRVQRNELKLSYRVIYSVLRSYINQDGGAGNPFSILLIEDLDFDETDECYNEFLNFLYTNGIKQFIWAEPSSAVTRNLVGLLTNNTYNVSVSQGFKWYDTRFGRIPKYGFVVEISKKRKK